jgi:hypothetical protein
MTQVVRDHNIEGNAASVASSWEDRRTQDRLKLMKTMHITRIDSQPVQETVTVVDLSREGLYFTVRSHSYRVGMEIGLLIPSLGFEGVCKVVRLETLPSGCMGIGCLLLRR